MFALFLLTFWLRFEPASPTSGWGAMAPFLANRVPNGYSRVRHRKRVATRESATGWRAQSRYLGTLLGVALAYFALAKLGLRLASINPSASPIWPPTGLALAAMLLGGLRIWPAIFIGTFAAMPPRRGRSPPPPSSPWANTLEAIAGGYMIERRRLLRRLRKPFDPAALERAIEGALNNGNGR